MQTAFSTFNDAIRCQISDLEKRCDEALNKIKAENDTLKEKLAEASIRHSRGNGTRVFEQAASFESKPESEFAPPVTPCKVSAVPLSSWKNLCVTPGNLTSHLAQVSDQSKELKCDPQNTPYLSEDAYSFAVDRSYKLDGDFAPASQQFSVESGTTHEVDAWGSVIRLLGPPRGSSSKPIVTFKDTLLRASQSDEEDVDPVILRWGILFAGLTTPMEIRRPFGVKRDPVPIRLRNIWLFSGPEGNNDWAFAVSTQTGYTSRTGSTVQSPHQWADLHTAIRVGALMKTNACMQRFTVHPESKLSAIHLLMQGVLILFDTIDIPMMAFHAQQTDFADHMFFISIFFWTFDLLFSFLQGYHSPQGVIEMRPGFIARHYLRTWFVFDFVVVGLDWFVFFLSLYSVSSSSSSSQLARVAKIRRIFRAGRVLRLAKVGEKLYTLLDASAGAEWIIMGGKIFGLLVIILIINHYIACLWYGVAELSDEQETWVTVQGIQDSTTFVRYFYSLHWSLTQFTPCTNDVAPANGMERFTASCIVLFALVVFSTFMSTLTAAIMQLKKMNFERFSEQVQIRDFLHRKQVRLELANRIWHYYRKHYRRRRKIVNEVNIAFFQALPSSLRVDVQTEVYLQTLIQHPLIRKLVLHHRIKRASYFCQSLCTFVPVVGHDVFVEGDTATSMYYLVSGVAIYHFYGQAKTIGASEAVAEACLWINDWKHCGKLTVNHDQCEILPLDVATFEACLKEVAPEEIYRSVRKYATLFAQQMQDNIDRWWGAALSCTEVDLDNQQCMLTCTDVSWLKVDLHQLATAAFRIMGAGSGEHGPKVRTSNFRGLGVMFRFSKLNRTVSSMFNSKD